jgi:hypothetical protein
VSAGIKYLRSTALIALLVLGVTLAAQWTNLPTDKIDLTAPTPRTTDGKPDLSGLWQTDIKFNANLAADLPPGVVRMTPWAQALPMNGNPTTVKTTR